MISKDIYDGYERKEQVKKEILEALNANNE